MNSTAMMVVFNGITTMLITEKRKRMKIRHTTTITWLTLLLVQTGVLHAEKTQLDINRISRTVAYTLPVFHLNQLPLDTHISTNAFHRYLETLDPARSYFLQSDIDQFASNATQLHKQLRKGDISFATNAYERLMNRMQDRLDYTKQLLDQDFQTDIDETFHWDRTQSPWPQNQEEWDNLWRKRIKNEYLGRLIAKQLDDTEPTPETPETQSTNTNQTASASETAQTQEAEYDETYEESLLTPEEFILEKYQQLLLTMQSFDQEMLLQRYLSAFSQIYDPHSDYLSPSGVEDFDINMKLSLVGIGAMLRPDDGAAKIVRLIPGGPAETDGRLKAGDKIIAVAQDDQEPVSILHWPLYKAVRLIRGEIDSKVTLTVIPASDRNGTRTRKIDLIRDEVKLEEQAAKSDLHEIDTPTGETRRLGVITLPDFYADFKATSAKQADARRASTDVKNLIEELRQEKIEGLILDLRNNGGGSLVEAIEIAGLFITSGPVVQVKERRGLQVLPDADPNLDYDGPLIILVNRLSASASEILAAALQDYGRALIIGDEHTHGKGTVQTLMSLGDKKGSLKLTTAGFYRINGGSTQLRGVEPDIVLPSLLDIMEVGEKELDHALPWDTIRPALYRKTDGYQNYLPQLTEQSQQRRAADPEFQVFLEQRARLEERYASKTVSLLLSERLAEAETERELDQIQESRLDASDDEQNDLILNETLHIMNDLIDLEAGHQPTLLAPASSLTDSLK
ncbi:MAG: tail-specific protease [Kiritimatiellaceae bacterium]|nr:MAG: tail-specific protease [Kiritimatiellaceae bacterium]